MCMYVCVYVLYVCVGGGWRPLFLACTSNFVESEFLCMCGWWVAVCSRWVAVCSRCPLFCVLTSVVFHNIVPFQAISQTERAA